MNCVEYEDLWNEVLDARTDGPSDLEHRLEEHALSCTSCRSTLTGYQTLRQAIGALGPPPAPSAGSSARLIGLMLGASAPAQPPCPAEARRRPARRLIRFAWIPLATAAALLVVAWPGRTTRREPIARSITKEAPLTIASFRPIESALDEAKEATIGLALEASAPAARIGREVLNDREASFDLGLAASWKPSRPALPESEPPPSKLIQSVGERLTARVSPLSDGARQAFSFLHWHTASPPPAGGSL